MVYRYVLTHHKSYKLRQRKKNNNWFKHKNSPATHTSFKITNSSFIVITVFVDKKLSYIT